MPGNTPSVRSSLASFKEFKNSSIQISLLTIYSGYSRAQAAAASIGRVISSDYFQPKAYALGEFFARGIGYEVSKAIHFTAI